MWSAVIVAAVFGHGCLAAGVNHTSVTEYLNECLTRGESGVYTGSTGVIMRNLMDGYQDDDWMQVVPGTFWVDDIGVPNQMYPDMDIDEDMELTVFRAAVGVVIAGNMWKFFPDLDNIQSTDWGYGVFYALDSNSCDGRCRYAPNYNGYDCPSGWVDAASGVFVENDEKIGTGGYPMGNPEADPTWGGGAGCHFEGRYDNKYMDQDYAFNANGGKLTGSGHCECDYSLKGDGDWAPWVDQWLTYGHGLHGGNYPNVDQAICWTNNIRDMINLQNTAFTEILTKKANWIDPNPVHYWGWNEVPLTRTDVGDPNNWDTVVVHVPPRLCGIGAEHDSVACLTPANHLRLESTLKTHIQHGWLLLGFENAGSRPGSYVVFVREFFNLDKQAKTESLASWSLEFYCETWSSPSGHYQIHYKPMTGEDKYGACYIDAPTTTTTTKSTLAPGFGEVF